MISTATKRLTFEEFEQMPEQPGKQELLEGELVELPPAKLTHNEIAERIFLLLHAIVTQAHARGNARQLSNVHHEMGYRFEPRGWLVPDVSITHADQQKGDYYLNAPALAVEVISDEKTADYIDKKLKLYLENGAIEVWVIYPNQQRMWIYKPGRIAEMYSTPFASGLLAGEQIDLDEILK